MNKATQSGSFYQTTLQTKIGLVMKITAVLLLTGCLQVSARGLAQERVNLHYPDISLERVLDSIYQQTGIQYLGTAKILDPFQHLSVDLKNATVEQALRVLLFNKPLNFNIVDKYIVISEKKAATTQPQPLTNSPGKEINGTITDDDGAGVASATISIKGTKQVIAANSKGEFLLNNIDPNATLVVSCVGYETQEYSVKGKTEIKISLRRKTGQLDETVIQGYGTTTQRYNVGSISKISAEEIGSQPVENPLAALEGRVPGLVVTQGTGAPGSSFTVQIRGQNSITQGSNPLFIIDGVPFSPQNNSLNQFTSVVSPILGEGLGLSPFSSINPSDIESIEVLKDADATAIYGSRGANGVILITTKKGKAGKTKLSGNVYTGGSQVTRTMPLMNTQQYLQMREEGFNNDGITPTPGTAPDLLTYDTTKYTNFKKTFIGGTSHTTEANIALSGGNNLTQFLLGGGYHHETTVFPGDLSANRGSALVNLNHKSTDQRLTASFSANYSFYQSNLASSGLVQNTFNLAPDLPSLLDSAGNLVWQKGGSYFNNPLAYLQQKYTAKTDNLISHLQIGYSLLPGLTLKSNFGFNLMSSSEVSIEPASSQNPAFGPATSYSSFGSNDFRTWIIEPQAEFTRSISKGKIDILVGGSFQQNTNTNTIILASNFSNDALLGSVSAAGSTSATGGYSLYKYTAAFGRVNYIWDSKYILDVTARRDGSSRFGPGRQFGDFGSIGGGWIFSQEPIFKGLPALSYGKLRATYGTTGNDQIGDYQYLPAWSSTSNVYYQGYSGLVPTSLFNPNYSWEVNKKLEGGLELGFFKDRLLANISYYRNRSGNQLINYSLPTQTGFSSVVANFNAEVQNTGLEIQVSSINITSKRFKWTTTFNVTVPKNELVAFPGLSASSYAATLVVGKPLSVVQQFKYAGVNATTGIYQFYTAKGELTYNPNPGTPSQGGDYQVVGELNPKYYGGMRNLFSYRGFQLDIFMEFRKQLGVNYLSQMIEAYGTPGSAQVNEPTAVLSRWQRPGQVTNIEMFTSNSGSPAAQAAYNLATSSGAYSDASFIRIKTVALSYNFQGGFLQKARMDGCRVYLNMQNLFTITDYKGNDPETQNYYSLPPLKTLVAGIQLTF